jgi:hypothetical protein
MASGHTLIRRSPEMYLVGYAMARSSVTGGPPAWLGVRTWNEAYDLFFPALGNGRPRPTFRNSLKNARDSFDGYFDNGRIGWRQSEKINRPPAPNRRVEETRKEWDRRDEAELREVVLDLIVSGALATKMEPNPSPFDPQDETDARRKVLLEVARRQGQRGFRKSLIEAYGGACAISGCAVLDVLQAAHIRPYTGPHRNNVTNGLLLRADLHTLFDLRLITIDPEAMLVEVSEQLLGSPYFEFHNTPIRLPADQKLHPNRKALEIMRAAPG